MSEVADVIAVYGGGPFREVGEPSVVSATTTGLVAVGGTIGHPQWNAYSAGAGPIRATAPVRGTAVGRWHRVGVYDAEHLVCRVLLPLKWPVNTLAFDPSGRVLAIGTGSYDGGYSFEGELLMLDLATGRWASVLDQRREVLHAEWTDERSLRIVLSPWTDEDENATPVAATLQAERWDSMEDASIAVADLTTRPAEPVPPTSSTDAAQALTQLAEAAGGSWNLRRQVWAVEATATGILACLEGVEIEAWRPDGTTAYRREAIGSGRQLILAGDAVVTNVQPPLGSFETGYRRSPSVVQSIAIESGEVIASHPMETQCVLQAADGWVLARDTNHDRRTPKHSVVFDGSTAAARPIDLGSYDVFNHYFAIRRAPHHLVLEGTPDQPWKDKWVARADPLAGSDPTRRLFPLEWDRVRDGHLLGGPGVFVADHAGDAIVHSGFVHHPQGLLPGHSFVVRRSYPDGGSTWVVYWNSQAIGIDEIDGLVVAAFIDGTILRIEATSGDVVDKRTVAVDGHPVSPLSMVIDGDGRVVVGTFDGRIVVLDLAS